MCRRRKQNCHKFYQKSGLTIFVYIMKSLRTNLVKKNVLYETPVSTCYHIFHEIYTPFSY